VRFAPHLFIVN